MKHASARAGVVVAIAAALAMPPVLSAARAAAEASPQAASPIYGVTLPVGYRSWEFVAPAVEAAPLDELRAVLGNRIAIAAYGEGALPFPDGTVLVKLAWKRKPSPEFEPATVPGSATTVQVMVKDARKYAATGGWGFGRFVDGAPVDRAQHETCWACHQALAKRHDFVFTRYAP